MNTIETFVRRPVATCLLTLGIALAGMIAFRLLPVSPLPQVDYPTIMVSASLPGASPETMAATVATPLERALGHIAGVTEMTSRSSQGSATVILQFDLSRNIDSAAREVQAALNAARSILPSSLTSNPSYRKINPADSPVLILALTSKYRSRGEMYDFATTLLAQKIAQIKGVGDVSVNGGALPAVRVEINPSQLNAYGISSTTVRNAIASTNANTAKGFVEEGPMRWQIAANDQALTAKEYKPLIVAYRNGAPVHLSDIATVTDSVENLRNYAVFNGEPSVLLDITRQPEANIIETVDAVKAMLPVLRASLPADVDMQISSDRSLTIRSSLHEVELTLIISVLLVTLVVFLFLRDVRATLVPAIAVPVSLIGTFVVMYFAGFSLNNLSLMALTIATGFVVDDAIVVMENITRHMENGMSRFEAVIHGAREVSFTVVSMSLSLISVFIPILLMTGIVGRLFREFAVSLSVAIIISLIVSLTTTPTMCARLLRVRHPAPAQAARPPGLIARFLRGIVHGYEQSLHWALAHKPFMLGILIATIGLNGYLYVIIPKGFFPQQDTGMLGGGIQGDQSSSFLLMRGKVQQFEKLVRADPAVETVSASADRGRFGGASGRLNVSLKPKAERDVSADQVIARLRTKAEKIPGARMFLFAGQDIRIGGRQSLAQYQYTLQADDIYELRDWATKIRLALAALPELTDINTDAEEGAPQNTLVYDRDALSRYGLTIAQVNAALYDSFGQRQVSTMFKELNQYRVVMEAAPQFAEGPESLEHVYLVASNGSRVPLSSVARYEPSTARLSVNHQGQFAATTISFNLAEGVTLTQASEAIEAAMDAIGKPDAIIASMQGTAKVYQQALASQPLLILAALIAVYIVLGILYESYIHPITILSTLPSAGVGALLALMVFKTEFSIIALIGVLLLVGIVKKNAIMMIAASPPTRPSSRRASCGFGPS